MLYVPIMHVVSVWVLGAGLQRASLLYYTSDLHAACGLGADGSHGNPPVGGMDAWDGS